MLTEIYIDTLTADPEAADQVWEAWFAGDIDDASALQMWWLVASIH